MSRQRYIVHADMDAFFAAVEQRDNPNLKNKPVIIGADPKQGKGRGVVSTCSYQARKFGVHSAMPISLAYKKCPKGVFLGVDMDKYKKVSSQVYETFYNFTPKIEPVGIDEAFLDITGSYHLFGSPLETCKLIKSGIKQKTGLTASVGLSPTKMAAKIASDINKPDGLVEVSRESLLDFLWPLDIGRIPGLGKKTKQILNNMGIVTIRDLAKTNIKELTVIFGKNGMYIWSLANGIDESRVEAKAEAKSISNEVTFQNDTLDKQKIQGALLYLCDKVSARLRKDNLKAKTVTLKIRLEGFFTYTRALTMRKSTNFIDDINTCVRKLYHSFDKRGRKVRLLGVKVSNFVCCDFPDSIFIDNGDKKKEGLHKAVDKIRDKFGSSSIYRAGIFK